MSKRKETTEIEKALLKMTSEKGFYGCEEVTVGFANQGLGKEIADFMLMEPKGFIRCYEIKVSISDLKSKAKLSWYGNYNYLVVSDELAETIKEWNLYVPDFVGVIAGPELRSIKRCKFQEISEETKTMLKESLVRTLYYKLQKHMDAQSIEKQRKLQQTIRRQDNEIAQYKKRAQQAENLISEFEYVHSKKTGEYLDLLEIIQNEKE